MRDNTEKKKNFVEMYSTGKYTQPQIAEALGVSEGTIYNWKKLLISKKTKRQEYEFCRLYKRGYKLAEIERTLQISHRTATYLQKKHGFKKSGQRLFMQVGKLLATGAFSKGEIAEMLHLPKESVDRLIRQNKENQKDSHKNFVENQTFDYQTVFNYFVENHNIRLLESEMQDIEHLIKNARTGIGTSTENNLTV